MFGFSKRRDSLFPSVLVVCIGNICRSPTGEVVLRHKARSRGMDMDIDSAGVAAFHVGQGADPRGARVGAKRGYSFKGIRSRQIDAIDYERFDLILAAEPSNIDYMKKHCPPEFQHKLHLWLDYVGMEQGEIPDPYYGSVAGFDRVLDIIEEASERLLDMMEEGKVSS
ncbi:low molecular weight protein-tyrosine-phosphatase [Aliagarivorans marinus]|nr:low molecular weight protein-tyrosine-phosphatase [Aliagarivorans marinus]